MRAARYGRIHVTNIMILEAPFEALYYKSRFEVLFEPLFEALRAWFWGHMNVQFSTVD